MKRSLFFMLVVIISLFFGFRMQESQKFYYGFNEKIPLADVENKLVVRYSGSMTKENASRALRRSSPDADQQWQDERTVTITTRSKDSRNKMIDELRKSSGTVAIYPVYKIKTGLEMVLTDEFLVKFKDNVPLKRQQEINRGFKASVVKSTDTHQLLKVPKGMDVLEVANKYQESGLVIFAHPNFIMEVEWHQQAIPNDPFFANQFALNNTGQVFNPEGHFGTADADIDAPECWTMTTGANILVAVLDQGVTPDHPDLPNARQVRLNGSNFADGDPNNPSPTGNSNHGNSCAGVIAATRNNAEGIAGVCTNCRIMPIRISNTNGSGISTDRLADAINFARTNGAAIISNSWGFNSDNPNHVPAIVTAIQTATTQGRNNLGCVVLFSAGNNTVDNGFVHFPSNVDIPGVITVGASDRNDQKSFYSPLGSGTTNNQVLDVTAPSHRAYPFQIATETLEAWSIDIPGNAGYNPWPPFQEDGTPSLNPPVPGEQLPGAGVNFQSYTGRFGGTSHSCPVVAGVAALVLSVNPNLTQQQVFNIITANADQVGGYTYTNGRSNELGFGRVNACRAVTAAFSGVTAVAPAGPVCTSVTLTTSNTPPGSTVTWASSNTNGLTVNPTTGLASRVSNFSGNVIVTATVTAPGGCASFTRTRTVFVGLPLASNSTLIFPSGKRGINPVSLCANCTYTFRVDFVAGATSYTWVLPSGFSFVSGSTTSMPGIRTSSTAGSYTLYCSANNACGPSWTHSLVINVGGGGQQQQINVYPNPARDELTVEYTSSETDLFGQPEVNSISPGTDSEIGFSATLLNEFSEAVKSDRSAKGKIVFDTRDVKPGLYFLKINNGGKITTQQIMIKK